MKTIEILEKLGAVLKQGRNDYAGLTPTGGLGVGQAAKIHSSLDNAAKPVMQRNKALNPATGVAPRAVEKIALLLKLSAGLTLKPMGTGLGNAAAPKIAPKPFKPPVPRQTQGQQIAQQVSAKAQAPAAPAPAAKPAPAAVATGGGFDMKKFFKQQMAYNMANQAFQAPINAVKGTFA